jgi:superfamily II DNA or RNA helicase
MPVLEPIAARIDGEIVLRELPVPALERLRLKLSLPNPKYVSLKRFVGFTGSEPAKIECLVEMPDGSIHVPRGVAPLIKSELGRYDLRPRMEDDARSRGSRFYQAPTNTPALRDYQQQGIDKLVAAGQGLIVLPCGTGKTKLGVGAVIALGVKALVLVHTEDLADQWLTELTKYGIDVGSIGGGTVERDADVVVAIIDSLLPLLESNPAWGRCFGFVVVDEAHHAPAVTFQRVLRLLPAYYRLGLTATPEREDGLSSLVDWSFGETLLERTTREMIKLGFLMPARIEIVSTGFVFEYDGPEKKRLAELEKAIAASEARNALIVQTVVREAALGETCLVLVRTREHARVLAELLVARGIEARALTGKTAKKKRKATLNDLRSGALPIMIATSLADEGLDLPRLSVIVLAAPQRAKGATLQRLGRLLRVWEGKKPVLYDFVDDEVDTLASRAASRRRVYLDCGLIQPAA